MQLPDDELAKLRQHTNLQGPHDPAAAWQLMQQQPLLRLADLGFTYETTRRRPEESDAQQGEQA